MEKWIVIINNSGDEEFMFFHINDRKGAEALTQVAIREGSEAVMARFEPVPHATKRLTEEADINAYSIYKAIT